MRFLNASVLERKSLNRNLSWGFPLGNLLPKTRVLKHRVLERKRRPNANASVLGTQRFRTLRVGVWNGWRHGICNFSGSNYPKDPAVLSAVRESELPPLDRILTRLPQIYYAVNPSLRGRISAIPRTPTGPNSLCCDSKSLSHTKFTSA